MNYQFKPIDYLNILYYKNIYFYGINYINHKIKFVIL